MSTSMISSAITHTEFDLTQVLHGEQYLEILDDLPIEGKLVTKGNVIDVIDKRSGAVVVSNCKFIQYYCTYYNFIIIIIMDIKSKWNIEY